jgi:hypothetical protein
MCWVYWLGSSRGIVGPFWLRTQRNLIKQTQIKLKILSSEMPQVPSLDLRKNRLVTENEALVTPLGIATPKELRRF